jgi:hypothetical protein
VVAYYCLKKTVAIEAMVYIIRFPMNPFIVLILLACVCQDVGVAVCSPAERPLSHSSSKDLESEWMMDSLKLQQPSHAGEGVARKITSLRAVDNKYVDKAMSEGSSNVQGPKSTDGASFSRTAPKSSFGSPGHIRTRAVPNEDGRIKGSSQARFECS